MQETITPDVATASEDYARRFAGPIGAFFLAEQEHLVLDLLAKRPGERLRVLEVGGGHAQLTPPLLAAGYEVIVQGSAPSCAAQLRPLMARWPGRLQFVSSSLWQLPFPDRAFDAVIAVRLLAHIERWQELLGEMARVSRRALLVDFPPRESFNLLNPLLFALKRRLEGNTRPFRSYHVGELEARLRAAGFGRCRVRRQFFLPMVLHRTLKRPALSTRLEGICRGLGLTALLGAPAVLAAERLEPADLATLPQGEDVALPGPARARRSLVGG